MRPPLAAGSVSLRLYPHQDLDPVAIVAELRAQATLGVEHGFDGVMTSEHHGGFAGYLPNPLQVAGWCLEAMPHGWAAACPCSCRCARPPSSPRRWPGSRPASRAGSGSVSPPARSGDDFEVMGLDMDDLAARFTASLETVTAALRGEAQGVLAGDPAVAACAETPVPIVSAAMGRTAVRRAARVGAGLLFDSLSVPERCRTLIDAYRDAGGTGPCILIRRAWLGVAPVDRVEAQLDRYRAYASRAAQAHWGDADQLVGASDAASVAEELAAVALTVGADAVNLRVHVPGVTPAMAHEQIAALGDHVVPKLHAVLAPPVAS